MSEVKVMTYSLSLNGKAVSFDRKKLISSVSIEENCDGADNATITISDPEYEYISDNIFVEEVKVKIRQFWLGSKDFIEFTGYISAVDPTFPEEGYPSITIHCVDESHKFNRKKNTRSWEKTTNAQVVRSIAKEHGYKCVIQEGYNFKTQESIAQSDQTDIEFMENLADDELYPFMCKIKDGTVYYVKRGLLSNYKAMVGYRTYPFTVKSFSPNINKETKKEEIADSNIDSSTKSTQTGTSTDSNTESDTQGDGVKTSSSSTTQEGYQFNGSHFVSNKADAYKNAMIEEALDNAGVSIE